MNNDTGGNGEKRESHSVILQWFSHDQSKTTTLRLCYIHLSRCQMVLGPQRPIPGLFGNNAKEPM